MGSEETEKIIYSVLKDNKGVIEDYKAGKKEALNFLVGQVMKQTRGRADPKEVSRMLRDKIESGF